MRQKNTVSCCQILDNARMPLLERARKLQRYLTQPFWTTASHTGIAGTSVSLATTLHDCDDFLCGKYDDVPESRCYMRGAMEES